MIKPCSSSHQSAASNVHCDGATPPAAFNSIVAVQLATARARVLAPEAPRLRPAAGGGPGVSQRRDVLRARLALELREVFA